jgi:mannose-6-phosphate isomerase-like protein (cupin superfamily)
MLTKKLADHLVIYSPFCGGIREILTSTDYGNLGIAIAVDIKPTTAHFHKTFDEICFVIDGELELEFYYPEADRTWKESLSPNELVVVSKGIHHNVVHASEHNRLCVVSAPHSTLTTRIRPARYDEPLIQIGIGRAC